ncbi:TPA: hypothetical protein F8R85_15650 [Legionella pneumophila]|nr:hypothetical protein [Legionella pneumophila]HAU1500473.1 hypothetical protein [Legionella pneumophila]HAU1519467.1 hypothetical protein [Legionella pneumophila]
MNLFIDTNVFLSFYQYSNDDLEEMKKLVVLIEKKKVTLWLTENVKDEFSRNRENKINEAIKILNEQKIPDGFPQICKDYSEYSAIRDAIDAYNINKNLLLKNIKNDVVKKSLKADAIISDIFKKSSIIETSKELVNSAKLRIDKGNPPGKENSLGDAINWEALLQKIPNESNLYLVADDKDYYSVLDTDKLKCFLIDDWEAKKGSRVIFYRRLSGFFKEHYPDIKLATDLEKELAIKSLVESPSFSWTHYAVRKLSMYDFNSVQLNEIIECCINNDQVGGILCDSDIYSFYKNLVTSMKDHINDDLLIQIQSKLYRCESYYNI